MHSGLLLAALVVTLIPAAAEAATANITFALPADRDIDFFRIYVGPTSKRYEARFDLREPALGAGGRARAMQQQLASLVSEPRLFFFAMTTVDMNGQESAFSNEIMIDMRGSDADFDGVLDRVDNCPRMSNVDQTDRGGVASPADPQGSRADGIGDACQCGDLNNSGTVTVADAQVIDMIGVIGGVMSMARAAPPAPNTCNVAGAAACDSADAQAIRAAVSSGGKLQPVCLAATRPSPDQNQQNLARALAGQCPSVDRGENRDPLLISFCNEIKRVLVAALARQCPAVARGEITEPSLIGFCDQLRRELFASRR